MKINKPEWVTHGESPIYSIHVRPNNSRIATGGAGNLRGAPSSSFTLATPNCGLPRLALLTLCQKRNQTRPPSEQHTSKEVPTTCLRDGRILGHTKSRKP